MGEDEQSSLVRYFVQLLFLTVFKVEMPEHHIQMNTGLTFGKVFAEPVPAAVKLTSVVLRTSNGDYLMTK